jgi:hypothetical protein
VRDPRVNDAVPLHAGRLRSELPALCLHRMQGSLPKRRPTLRHLHHVVHSAVATCPGDLPVPSTPVLHLTTPHAIYPLGPPLAACVDDSACPGNEFCGPGGKCRAHPCKGVVCPSGMQCVRGSGMQPSCIEGERRQEGLVGRDPWR